MSKDCIHCWLSKIRLQIFPEILRPGVGWSSSLIPFLWRCLCPNQCVRWCRSGRIFFQASCLLLVVPILLLDEYGILIFSFCICSVFTPYYSETVIYSVSELQKKNEDGISILFYLQKIYPGTSYFSPSFVWVHVIHIWKLFGAAETQFSCSWPKKKRKKKSTLIFWSLTFF